MRKSVSKYRAVILTSSDKGFAGEREDLSGKVIEDIVIENGYDVVKRIILPDDFLELSEVMQSICDENRADLLITTGGTGFSSRDIMPEVTLEIGERQVPGIPEAMRQNSLNITKRAMLSRGVSVIRKKTLIINLPGSPKAVKENLEFIITELEHGLDILIGNDAECAR